MDPRVLELAGGDLRRVNVDPRLAAAERSVTSPARSMDTN
jgi:hypothetical protein